MLIFSTLQFLAVNNVSLKSALCHEQHERLQDLTTTTLKMCSIYYFLREK